MRADNNQKGIVDFLRAIGVSVQILSQVGGGAPDLLIGLRGANYLIEVKGEKGKLRPNQQEWHDAWRGKVCVIHNVVEMHRFIELTEIE